MAHERSSQGGEPTPQPHERTPPAHEPTEERVEVFYSGRVQGVGFRYTVQHIARGYAVTGFVKNLVDGRVQLVAEGRPEAVAGLLEEIDQDLGHHVRHAQRSAGPATGRFRTFQIAF